MDEALIKRVMPHSIEAEQAVIGSMLMDKDAIAVASDMITKDDFYTGQYGLFFEAMAALYKEGKPADIVQVQDKLKQMGAPAEIAGLDSIREVLNSVPTSVNIKHYAKIVKDKSILRKLIKEIDKVENDCYDGKEEVENILAKAEGNITKITRSGDSDEITPISDVVMEALDRIEEASKAGGHVTGIATGFKHLDYKTAGLQNSDFILVAARPSMGKTAFVLNIAQYVAVKNHTPTAIFSLEMSKVELVNRLISMESKVDSKNIRSGNLSPAEWTSLSEGASKVGESSIMIDDTPGISIGALCNKCRKMKRENNLGLIIIDYIQLMTSAEKNESRQQEVSSISRQLKGIARELNVPVIALSQLSRQVESRDNKRPMMSDLRESGAIEQDADVIMFIYRDEYYNKDKPENKGLAEIIIAKQRKGPIGTVDLAWIADLTKFADLEVQYKHDEE